MFFLKTRRFASGSTVWRSRSSSPVKRRLVAWALACFWNRAQKKLLPEPGQKSSAPRLLTEGGYGGLHRLYLLI
jgi:hypothetical protein